MRSNEGVYQCFAVNIYGRSMSTFAELRMATVDTGSPATNQILAVEGQSVMIGCREQTKCFPVPIFLWELKADDDDQSTVLLMDRRRQIDQHGKCRHNIYLFILYF